MCVSILFVLAGSVMLLKGEIPVSENRYVTAWRGRMIGAALLVAAVSPWVIENLYVQVAVMFGIALVAVALGIWSSEISR